jgi:DNA-binding response OmpR family regulator
MVVNEDFEGMRILLVEDDMLIAMEMEDFLGELGCEIAGPFGRLEDALEAATSLDVDGAILDLNLRGELSFPVVEKLREREVPVILCSGYVELPDMKQRLSGIPTISKPCLLAHIVAAMGEHFRRRVAGRSRTAV